MRKSHEARQKLLRLGIFRRVEVVIDTSRGTESPDTTLRSPRSHDASPLCFEVRRMFVVSRGDDALPNGLDVTFEVTELRRMTGSYNTMVGNNEGSMVRCMMSRRRLLTDGSAHAVIVSSRRVFDVLWCFDVAGSGPEVTQYFWSGRENNLPVLLWHQRDVLRPVFLQTAARTL